MRILMVGAGAVGQVYGWHLAQAGHEVSFFVKPKYVQELGAGLKLHRLGYLRSRAQEFRDFAVVSTVEAVAAQAWDQVWLALSSDALRGELAREVLGAVGAATVVCLQPDLEDARQVQALVPPAQVVSGLITFISYQSPLPGRAGPEGIAYFLPPLAPGLFGGEAVRVQAVVSALQAGGMSAKVVADFARATSAAPAMMQPLIAALELKHWRLGEMPGSAELALGLAASREALAVAAAETGADTRPFRPLLQAGVWRVLLPLVRRLLPLDLEHYLHYHFSKVGVQTRLMLDTFIRLGEKQGLTTAALQALRRELPEEPERLLPVPQQNGQQPAGLLGGGRRLG